VENKSVTSASEVKVRLRTKTEILGGRGLEGWQDERIEELVESREYSSKNAVVQDWLADAEKVNQLESELERCWRARRQLLEQREENQELVRYAEQRRTAIERPSNAAKNAEMHPHGRGRSDGCSGGVRMRRPTEWRLRQLYSGR
jgi:Arc/MetJ-type ribon-helix-helix transcriptional regulator